MSPRGSWPRGGVRTRLPVVFRKSGAEFTPRDITGLALWLDASDASTLFQDAAATTPATATSDPVGAWLDKSGNGRHATQSTAGSRPLVGSVNSRRAITFDGTDDFLTADIATTSLCSTAGGVAFYIAVPNNDSTWAAFTNSGPVGGIDRFADNASYHGNFRATRFNSITSGAYSTTGAQLIVSRANASTGLQTIRKDGATIYSASENIAGYRGLATTASVNVGTTVTSAGPPVTRAHFLAGSIPEILCYSSPLTDSQVARIERYLAARWGITLAPQVSNADAQDWINRVYANGGTVSSSTAAAVNAFCDAIDAAAIRDRFYRMGIFAGSNLNAALVPLYRGPSLGGTQYGGATDTNNGPFVPADYNETGASGGLQGNGNKWLTTGLQPHAAASAITANGHLSIWAMTHPASRISVIGCRKDFTSAAFAMMQLDSVGTVWAGWGTGTAINGETVTGAAPRFLAVTRRADGRTYLCNNGEDAFSATNAAAAVTSAEFGVFRELTEAGQAGTTSSRIAGYSVGAELSASQSAALYAAWRTFQNSLQRNV